MKNFHIILASILILSGVGFAPIVYAEEYAAGHEFTSRQSFAENVKFGGGVEFDSGYTFPAGTFFLAHIILLEIRSTSLQEME